MPYQKIALKVENTEFNRKDLVEFIRFNQRLSEEQGNQFDLGSSLFQSLQLLAENEIAYLYATEFGLTVEKNTETDEDHIYFYQNEPNPSTNKVDSGISIQNILSQYEYVQNCLDSGVIPDRDFELQYSDSKIDTL